MFGHPLVEASQQLGAVSAIVQVEIDAIGITINVTGGAFFGDGTSPYGILLQGSATLCRM
jgi:hypothetical protein